jgi:hypothetical protein
MHRFKAFVFLFLLMTLAITVSCDDILSPFTSDSESMSGIITHIQTQEYGVRILVEEDMTVTEPLDKGGGKVWYAITEKTEIMHYRNQKKLTAVDGEFLKKGQIVKVWSTGIVQTSYPSQTGAKRVIILKKYQ